MLTAHLNQKISDLIPEGETFAIAYSGGGDSTALIHALKDHPQSGKAYIVDHDLRRGSGAEAEAAQGFARSCGYEVKVLKWQHEAPTSALQEKARKARYGLMGGQCREDGVKYLLTAHSEDDQAETLLMRYERKTDWRGAAGMAELTYGPVWPELAMVKVVRPLLGISRQELRDYNRVHNLSWAEDPSNQNRDYARIRARDYLGQNLETRSELLSVAAEMREYMQQEKTLLREQFALIGQIDVHGIILLTGLPVPELLFHCLRSASGQGGPIDRAKLRHLLSKMRRSDFKSATLGGALVAKYMNDFIVCRDPVSVKGRQDTHHERREIRSRLGFRLKSNAQIWDGRFSVTGAGPRNYMGAVHHNYEWLKDEQRKALKNIPAAGRPTLPVSKHETSIRAIGHYEGGSRTVISLIRPRLEAALSGKLT